MLKLTPKCQMGGDKMIPSPMVQLCLWPHSNISYVLQVQFSIVCYIND